MTPSELRQLTDDVELMEVGRKAVEDVLIHFRDNRISVMQNNGLVVREADGRDSSIIRLGSEEAFRIAIEAIATHLENKEM